MKNQRIDSYLDSVETSKLAIDHNFISHLLNRHFMDKMLRTCEDFYKKIGDDGEYLYVSADEDSYDEYDEDKENNMDNQVENQYVLARK